MSHPIQTEQKTELKKKTELNDESDTRPIPKKFKSIGLDIKSELYGDVIREFVIDELTNMWVYPCKYDLSAIKYYLSVNKEYLFGNKLL